ncbi:MAG: DNA polymerase III subunit beta [Planctomycetota bacterium]
MKITCDRNLLLAAFQIVSSIVPSRNTIPILQNIKITTGDKSILIIGTDLEVGVRYELPAEIKEKGTILFPTQRLGAILRESADEKIQIESDGHISQVKTENGYFKIMGTDPADYPDFPDFDAKKAVSIESQGLKEMIRKTIFATSGEIARYALTGVLLEISKKELRMVGSDGKRLAYIKRKSEVEVAQNIKVIVPPKSLALLERIIQDDNKQVLLTLEETQLKIQLSVGEDNKSSILIFSGLIEGNFPDYTNVIPSDCDKKAEVVTEEFYSAIRRAALVTTDKFKATKLIFKNNSLTLFSRTQDVGEAQVEMKAKYEGKPFEIVFNPEFFIDVLRVINEKEFTMEFKDKASPMILKIGRNYVYLVMPLSVDV